MTVPTLYSISGNVSEDIGLPMEGALVTDSSGAETYTDENGDYVLTGLQPGVHEVEVSRRLRVHQQSDNRDSATRRSRH